MGENLTHIDDCHVLVVQEGGHQGNTVDFDKYIVSKIREITVRFERKDEEDLSCPVIEMQLDPKLSISHCLQKLSEATGLEQTNIDLFKCYSTKNMMKRPAEYAVDLESDKNLESLLEWCKEGTKTIFYCKASVASRRMSYQAQSHQPLEEQLDYQVLSEDIHNRPSTSNTSNKPSIKSASVEEDIMDTV